jgi:hypothetical protein
MPIPTPSKKQTKQDFISSCMGDNTMVKEFGDQKQRAAVCYSKWAEKKSKASVVLDDGEESEAIFE